MELKIWCVSKGCFELFGGWTEADDIIEDAGLLIDHGSYRFREENILKVISVLRLHGYEVTLPANWPHLQDDAPHTEAQPESGRVE